MNIFVLHNIDRPKRLQYLEWTLHQLFFWRSQLANDRITEPEKFNIFIRFDSDKGTEEDFQEISAKFKWLHRSSFYFLPTQERFDEVVRHAFLLSKGVSDSNVLMESHYLLPFRHIRKMLKFPENQTKNIWVPSFNYKYRYKDVKHNETTFRGVKEFIQVEDHFSKFYGYIPDWDERFLFTRKIDEKLNGKMPPISPSPLLHDWGNFRKLMLFNDYDGDFDPKFDVTVNDSNLAIHTFEEVEDENND